MSNFLRKLKNRMMIWMWLRPPRPIDIATLAAVCTAGLAIVLTLASRFPSLKSTLGLDANLSDVTVLFLAIILLLLYKLQTDARDNSVKLLERLNGAEFRTFNSSDEQILYIASKINRATQSICDITWIDYWGAYRTSPQRESAGRVFDDAVMTFAAHKPYRELFVFDSIATENRKSRIERLKARAIDSNNGYYCAYLPQTDLPRFQFIIIDDEVVLHSSDVESNDVRCAIRHPEISRLFRAYYARLWRNAKMLKDDYGPKREELERFLKDDPSSPASAGSAAPSPIGPSPTNA